MAHRGAAPQGSRVRRRTIIGHRPRGASAAPGPVAYTLRMERDDDHDRAAPYGAGALQPHPGFGDSRDAFGYSPVRFGYSGRRFGYSPGGAADRHAGRQSEGEDRPRNRGRHWWLRDGSDRLLPLLREPQQGRTHGLRVLRGGRSVLRGRCGRRDHHVPGPGSVHGDDPYLVAPAAGPRAPDDRGQRVLQRRRVRRDPGSRRQGAVPRPDAGPVRHRSGGRPQDPRPPGRAPCRPRHDPRPPLGAGVQDHLADLQGHEELGQALQRGGRHRAEPGDLRRLERVQG